ncbi:GNAT family N-acetyltransferase [Paenibacillus sp. GYB003]|uniref:GNAT family N-acetyltransferase n=1 Tax=Paenibacillus sp. GYB003 TaxID=2994392 RepID=UPI002F963DD4
MSLIIRDAAERDIPGIIELRKQLDDVHAEQMPALFQSAYLYDEERVRSFLEAEKSKVIVVEMPDDDGIVAYAVLNQERVEEQTIFKPKTMIYVNDICVRKELRGTGIGKTVMAYIINCAKEMKVDTVELNVFCSNESAVRLYEAMGLKDQNKRMVLRL